jgi:RNA polymerase sigma-70 factor, ECF subfamily
MSTEHDIAAIATGDRNAFTRLYRTHQSALLRFATGLLAGDQAAAEDAVDEAFIAIWEQAGRYDGQGHVIGWMRSIVRNKAIDWLRKQKHVSLAPSDIEQALAHEADSQPDPFEAAATLNMAETLRHALEQLSIEQREAVWLCYFEDKPLSEIAETACCPENTVKTRLFHARRILRSSGLLESVR